MEETIKIIGLFLTVLGTIMTAYKFFWKAPSEKESVVDNPESIDSRFISLFESHGVHRNQIPEFFGHNLTLHQCSSNDELSKVLTPEILKDATDLFAVNIVSKGVNAI